MQGFEPRTSYTACGLWDNGYDCTEDSAMDKSIFNVMFLGGTG
jgi:hypothetical protein